MLKIVFKRFLILGFLFAILVVLQMNSEESLLLNLPSEYDVINVLAQERAQKEELLKAQKKYEELQEELLDYYKTKLIEQQEYILLEQVKQEEQRIKEIEQQIKYAYTLGDRDKPLDYQKLFDNSIKHTFVIDFDSTEWQGLLDDMNAYQMLYGTYRSNEYHKVDVTYFADEEQIFIPDVGIRTKGNIYSRRLPEDENGAVRPVHWVLKFNETFDTVEGSTEYDWLKTREVFDQEQLVFKWNRVYDPSYINEVYSFHLFNEAGVILPNMTLAKYVIRIDGEVQMEELYSVSEQLDEEFIRKKFQDIPTKEVGDMYKVIWPGTLEPIYDSWSVGVRDWENNLRPTYGKETNQENENYSNLINFTRYLGNYSDSTLKTYLEENFNVDMFIKTMAVNVLLGNPDDYRGNANNYYLYFDENNYLSFIPFDYDNSMGEGWDGDPQFINYSLGNDIYNWGGFQPTPLVDKILSYEVYQVMYENYLEHYILSGMFSYSAYQELFDTFNAVYGDEFSMSNNKYYYIATKRNAVLNDISYYRDLRD